jgi:hypothetical protein
VVGAQSPRHLQPVAPRQADVQQGDVGRRALRDLDRANAVVNHLHLVAAHLQQPPQGLGRVDVVVGDQDVQGGGTSRGRLGWMVKPIKPELLLSAVRKITGS